MVVLQVTHMLLQVLVFLVSVFVSELIVRVARFTNGFRH